MRDIKRQIDILIKRIHALPWIWHTFSGTRKALVILIPLCILVLAIIFGADIPGRISQHNASLKPVNVTQEDSVIIASWDDMGCDSYDLVWSYNEHIYRAHGVQGTEYKVINAIPGQVYHFKVYANYSVLRSSAVARGEYTAGRIAQKMELNIYEKEGFPKDTLKVEMLKYGPKSDIDAKVNTNIYDKKLKYRTADNGIASVDQKGNVLMRSPGHTTISVIQPGNLLYEDARAKVEIYVYPEHLNKTEAKMTEKTDTDFTLSWEPVPYAGEYRVEKKDTHTGKYKDLKVLKGTETTVKLDRNSGSYRVVAAVDVGKKTAKGEPSKTFNIVSKTESAKAYGSLHTVGTIGRSDVKVLTYLSGNANKNPQSLAFNGSEYIIGFVNSSSSSGQLEVFDTKGKFKRSAGKTNMGHANGMTYNKNTGRLYVMKTYAGHNYNSIVTFDGKSLANTGDISIGRAPSGVAYDESNDKNYMTAGENLYVTDGNFKTLQKTIKRLRDQTSQDVGAYNGVALSCISLDGNDSYIDMYRESDGAYIGSFHVPIGEVESVVVKDGYFVILANTIGSSRDALYITKKPVKMP